jgi:ABC-2 type transport system permease protein
MPLHDIHYQHWTGVSTGIWARRRVITKNGLAACLQNRALRMVVIFCWVFGLIMVAALFFASQLLVPDSLVARSVEQFNPDLQAFANLLTTWMKYHPEISVRTMEDVLFFYGSTLLTPVAVFALGVAMPFLITRDLASSAIVIYSSKAITRGDYLLGKFCIAFGLLCLIWLGPLCGAWLVGNLLAPDWKFFWHSRAALANLLIYGLSSMAILSALALGVSAISSKEKSTPALWFAWWVLGGVIQPIALHTKPWLSHLSFTYNLAQLRLATFRLGNDIKTAQDNIPILGQMLKGIPKKTMEGLSAPAIWGAVVALLLMLAGAALVIRKRVRPE